MAHELVLSEELRAALDELCQLRMFSPKIWLGTSSPAGNAHWEEECKVLIRLAGKFANLLHEDAKDKEMVRRGGLLRELTGPGSSLYDAGKVLVIGIKGFSRRFGAAAW